MLSFGDENFFVALQNFADIARQRIQMAQVHVADFASLFTLFFHSLGYRAKRGTPGNQKQVALGVAGGRYVGNVLTDGFHFRGADAHHFFVVQRLVVHVAGDFLLFNAADAVLKARGTRNGPRARQRLRVALIGEEAFGICLKFHGDGRDFLGGGDAPGLRTIREIAVGQNDDRHHVFERDATGFECGPETIAGRGRGQHGNRSFRIAAEHRLQQIGLLGLRRQSGGRPTALNVADYEGQFGHYSEAQSFCLQRHAGARSRGDGQCAGIGGADGTGDGSNFVFGLEREDAEILVLRELMQNVGGRRNRVTAEVQLQTSLLRRGDEADGQSLIAAEVAIRARRKLRGRNS